jgi:hypothetical protein
LHLTSTAEIQLIKIGIKVEYGIQNKAQSMLLSASAAAVPDLYKKNYSISLTNKLQRWTLLYHILSL